MMWHPSRKQIAARVVAVCLIALWCDAAGGSATAAAISPVRQDTAAPIVVPFDHGLPDKPFIVVQIKVDDRPALPFLVDTACGPGFFMLSWAAKHLGVPINGRSVEVGPGSQQAQVVQGRPI